jgi:hypothetical protein
LPEIVQAVEEQIEQKKIELQESKIQKQQQQEYEQLKAMITTFPKRSESRAAIDKVAADIACLEQESQRLDSLFAVRSSASNALSCWAIQLCTGILQCSEPLLHLVCVRSPHCLAVEKKAVLSAWSPASRDRWRRRWAWYAARGGGYQRGHPSHAGTFD